MKSTLLFCRDCRVMIEDGDEYRPYGEPLCLDCAIVWERDRYGDEEAERDELICGCCGRHPDKCWKEAAR